MGWHRGGLIKPATLTLVMHCRFESQAASVDAASDVGHFRDDEDESEGIHIGETLVVQIKLPCRRADNIIGW